jgi:Sulfotransferase domain
MRYPDFFIVGAAKSGTTSLWKYLGNHPDIYMTKEIENKELGFFCHDYGIKSEAEYLKYFMSATPGQLIGESCHAYLTSPESAGLIRTQCPTAKIIVILRNPAKRCYSLYNWMVQNGYEYLSFRQSLQREKKVLMNKAIVNKWYYQSYWRNYLYLESGKYYEQVKRYTEEFSIGSVLVILAEDLSSSPLTTTNIVLDFLGLRRFKEEEIAFNLENKSKEIYFPLINFVIYYLIRGGKIVENKSMKRAYWIVSKNQSEKKVSRLSARMREYLRDYYRDDIVKLEKLINRDLSMWLNN